MSALAASAATQGREPQAKKPHEGWPPRSPAFVSHLRDAASELGELAVLLGEQIVEGDTLLGLVGLHLVADLFQALVEVGVALGERELLLEPAVAHACELV